MDARELDRVRVRLTSICAMARWPAPVDVERFVSERGNAVFRFLSKAEHVATRISLGHEMPCPTIHDVDEAFGRIVTVDPTRDSTLDRWPESVCPDVVRVEARRYKGFKDRGRKL